MGVKLRAALDPASFDISLQDRTHCLFDFPQKKFRMKPDIVVTRKVDGAIFILDTKWKLLDAAKPNAGIVQTDMYQMFAYQKKYGAVNVTLLYPQSDRYLSGQKLKFSSSDGATVDAVFIDMFDIQSSVAMLAQRLAPAANAGRHTPCEAI